MSPKYRRFNRLLATAIAVCLLAASALAVVVQQPVTPASAKEKGSRFSVEAVKSKDGMVHFTITYRLPEPQYLVAHFELRDGQTLLAKTDSPGFVHEDSATYYVAVQGKYLKDSKFELSQNGMSGPVGHSIAEPGGMIFQIDLEAFGKDAAAK
jgi:opacity protein-like surface antigen